MTDQRDDVESSDDLEDVPAAAWWPPPMWVTLRAAVALLSVVVIGALLLLSGHQSQAQRIDSACKSAVLLSLKAPVTAEFPP